MEICIKCNKIKSTHTRDVERNSICRSCYVPKLKKCSICNKMGVVNKLNNNEPICCKCYQKEYNKNYKRQKIICSICNKLQYICTRDSDGNPICIVCNRKNKKYIPKVENCSICNKIKAVHLRNDKNEPICRRCYSPPKKLCTGCKKQKYINKNYKNGEMLCCDCRFLFDEEFRIAKLIKHRVREALKQYSKTGKVGSSKKYGIDYYSIIKYIGPCPGDFKDYHIDHIFPLCAFNLNNKEHIKLAFSPKNHQWLKKEENLNKGFKYDKNKFEEYINFGVLKK